MNYLGLLSFSRALLLCSVAMLSLYAFGQSKGNDNNQNIWLKAEQREMMALPLVTLTGLDSIPIHEFPTIYSHVISKIPEGFKVRCRNFHGQDMYEIFEAKSYKRIGFVFNYYIEHTGKLRNTVDGMRAGTIVKYRNGIDGKSYINWTIVDDYDIVDNVREDRTIVKIGNGVKPNYNLYEIAYELLYDDSSSSRQVLKASRDLYEQYKEWLTIEDLLNIGAVLDQWGKDEEKTIVKEVVDEAIRRDKEYVQLLIYTQGSDGGIYPEWVEKPFWMPDEVTMFSN